jgi:hypothetical protein
MPVKGSDIKHSNAYEEWALEKKKQFSPSKSKKEPKKSGSNIYEEYEQYKKKSGSELGGQQPKPTVQKDSPTPSQSQLKEETPKDGISKPVTPIVEKKIPTTKEELQSQAKEYVQKLNEYKTQLSKSINHFNEHFGTQFNADEILSSADKTSEFLQKFKQNKVNTEVNIEQQRQAALRGSEFYGQPLPASKRQPIGIQEPTDIPSFVIGADKYIELLKNHVVIQSIVEEKAKKIPKNQILEKIAKRLDPKEYSKIVEAMYSIPDINTLNPASQAGQMYDYIFGDNSKDELLDYQKGHAEILYNNALQQIANDKISQGIVEGNQDKIKEGQTDLNEVDNEAIYKHPSLIKQKIAESVSKAVAEEAGLLEGTEAKSAQGKSEKFMTKYADFISKMKEQGWLDNPKTKEAATYLKEHPYLFTDASYFGSAVSSFLKPLKELGLSLGDMTRFRTKKDSYADMIRDSMFPSEMTGLKESTQIARNIVNTSFNLAGMMAISVATQGLGAEAGLSSKAAERLSHYTSFGLPSYDGYIKDSYRFLDNDYARSLYATIGSIANAELGKYLDFDKIITPEIKNDFISLAKGISKKTLTEDAAKELLGKTKVKISDVLQKYAVNVTKGAATMSAFDATNGIEKLLFGDPSEKAEDILPKAAKSFLDGVLGMSILGGFGAVADIKKEKNTSYKGTIYNMSRNYDSYKNVFDVALKNGEYTQDEYNQKIKILNSSKVAYKTLETAQSENNTLLNERQKAVFVANKTAISFLLEKLESLPKDKKGDAKREEIKNQINRLDEINSDTFYGLRFNQVLEPLYDLYEAENKYNESLSGLKDGTVTEEQFQKDKEWFNTLQKSYEENKMYSDFSEPVAGLKLDGTPLGEEDEVSLPSGEKGVIKSVKDGVATVLDENGEESSHDINELFPSEGKKELTTDDLKPTIVVNGKEYSGKNHGEAMDKAIAAGENIPDKDTPEGKAWRSENGMFKDKDGNLLTRDESEEKYGIRNSEELSDNKEKPAVDTKAKQMRDTEIVSTYQGVKPLLVKDAEAIITPIIERINNAEYINENELEPAREQLYDLLDKIDKAPETIYSKAEKEAINNLIEPLISKIENYEFKTKTETRTVTEKESTGTSTKVKRENKPALEQSVGGKASVTEEDGTVTSGTLKLKDGNYVLESEGAEPIVIGETQITNRDLKLPDVERVPEPIQFDENGNVKSVTFETKDGKLVTIEDPEKALDIAIQLQADAVGEIPDAAFDQVYKEVEKTIQVEVPVNDIISQSKPNQNGNETSSQESRQKSDEESGKESGKESRKESDGQGNGKGDVLTPEDDKTGAGKKETAPVISSKSKSAIDKLKEKRKRKLGGDTSKTQQSKGDVKPIVHTVENIDKVNTTGRTSTQKKVLEDAKNVVKSISKLVETSTKNKLRLVIHDSPDTFGDALEQYGEDRQLQGVRGFYMSEDGTIHLNMNELKDDTMLHEGFHPVLDFIQDNNPDSIDKLFNQLENVKGLEEIVKSAKKAYGEYGDITVKKEAITDFIAKVANGDIKIDKTNIEKIKDFINKVLDTVGLKKIAEKFATESGLDLTNAQDLKKLAKLISEKFESGKEIKDKELFDKEAIEKNPNASSEYISSTGKPITNRQAQFNLHNDFSDVKTKVSFTYIKNSKEFDKLKEDGYITEDKKLSDFKGKYIFLHSPDAAFTGEISKNGEILIKGNGGIFYPIRFHKDGYFWASTSTAAKSMANQLNSMLEKNGGTIYMALTSAPPDKLLSSTTGSTGVVDFFLSKHIDKTVGIKKESLRKALLSAANDFKILQKIEENEVKEKKVGLNLKLSYKTNLSELEKIIKTSLSPDKSSFQDRKHFSIKFIQNIANEIKGTKSEQALGRFFKEGISNTKMKGQQKSGEYKLSGANITQAISYMLQEPMLRGEDSQKVYAILEVNGKVKAVDSKAHDSYPKAIQSEDENNKVKLHILQDRESWMNNFADPETGELVNKDREKKVYPTSGVSVESLLNVGKKESQKQDVEKSKQKNSKVQFSKSEPLEEKDIENKDLKTFTLAYAPFREGNINNISDSSKAFENKKYKQWVKMGEQFASDLGIEINSQDESIGIYGETSSNAEASSVLSVRGEESKVDLMAALMGTLAPDAQHSVLKIKYDEKGDASEHRITFRNKQDAIEFLENRKEYGLNNISLLPNSNSAIVLDFGNFETSKFNKDYGRKVKSVERSKFNSETAFGINENTYGDIIQGEIQRRNEGEVRNNFSDVLKLAGERSRRLGRDYNEKSEQAKRAAIKAVDDYVEKNKNLGIPDKVNTEVKKIDADYAKATADEYLKLPTDDSKNPEVASAYNAAVKEINLQYDYLTKDLGVNVEFITDDPYPNSDAMFEDVINNNHLSVYKGGEPHPFLGESSRDEKGITANEKLRAVHDYFGHFVNRNQFGGIGEERAWVDHSKMFSPEAQRAVTTETRGQNSVVNFSGINEEAKSLFQKGNNLIAEGKVAEGNKLIAEGKSKFQFAEQKVGLLPEERSDWSKYKKESPESAGDESKGKIMMQKGDSEDLSDMKDIVSMLREEGHTDDEIKKILKDEFGDSPNDKKLIEQALSEDKKTSKPEEDFEEDEDESYSDLDEEGWTSINKKSLNERVQEAFGNVKQKAWDKTISNAVTRLKRSANAQKIPVQEVAKKKITSWFTKAFGDKVRFDKEGNPVIKNKVKLDDEDLATIGLRKAYVNDLIKNKEYQVDSAEDYNELEDLVNEQQNIDYLLRAAQQNAGRTLNFFNALLRHGNEGKVEVKRKLLSQIIGTSVPNTEKELNEAKEYLSPDKAKELQDAYDQIDKLKKSLEKAEADYKENINSQVEAEVSKRLTEAQKEKSKTNVSKILSQKGKNVADQLRKLISKQKGGTTQKSKPEDVSFSKGDFNTAVEEVAKYVDSNMSIAEAIDKMVSDGSVSFETKKDRTDFEKILASGVRDSITREEALSKIGEMKSNQDADSITQEMVDKGLIKDYVESHVSEGVAHRDVLNSALDGLQELFPDLDRETLRDAYLKEGYFSAPTESIVRNDLKDSVDSLRKTAKLEKEIELLSVGQSIAKSKSVGDAERVKSDYENQLAKEKKALLDERSKLLKESKKDQKIKEKIRDIDEKIKNLVEHKSLWEKVKKKRVNVSEELSKKREELRNELIKNGVTLSNADQYTKAQENEIAKSHNERVDSVIEKLVKRLNDDDVSKEEKSKIKDLLQNLERSIIRDTEQASDEKIKKSKAIIDTAINTFDLPTEFGREIKDDLKKSKSDLSKDQKSSQEDLKLRRAKKSIQARINKAIKDLASGNFSEKKSDIQTKKDAEYYKLNFQRKKAENDFNKEQAKFAYKNKSFVEKFAKNALELRRANLISGLTVLFGKIPASVGIKTFAETAINQSIGRASMIFSKAIGLDKALERQRVSLLADAYGIKDSFLGMSTKQLREQKNIIDSKLNDTYNEKTQLKKEGEDIFNNYGEKSSQYKDWQKRYADANDKFKKATLWHSIYQAYEFLDPNAWATRLMLTEKDENGKRVAAKSIIMTGSTPFEESQGGFKTRTLRDEMDLHTTKLGKAFGATLYSAEIFGRLHGVLKDLSARKQFMEGYIKRVEKAIQNNEEMTPEKIMHIIQKSYDVDYLGGKYQQKNKWVEAINSAKERAYGSGRIDGKIFGTLLDIATPVLKVPVNIEKDFLRNYTFGALYAPYELLSQAKKLYKENKDLKGDTALESMKNFGEAFKTQMENLDPQEADAIVEAFNKGLVGATVFTICALMASNGNLSFGGSYNPNKKKKVEDKNGNELDYGQFSFNGKPMDKTSSKILSHTPVGFNAIMASTMIDSKKEAEERLQINQDKERPSKITDYPSIAVPLGMLEESVNESALKGLTGIGDFRNFTNSSFNGFTSLMLTKDISEYFDKDENGNLIERHPTNMLQQVETRVGLRKLADKK